MTAHQEADPRAASVLDLLTRVDIGPRLVSGVAGGWVWIVLGFGILCRAAQYLHDREMWQDEGKLFGEICSKPLGRMFGPIDQGQLAPAGFLVAEKLAALAMGATPFHLRLLPLVGGVAALVLALAVARRVLDAGAVTVAVALMAVSNDLIYFASELKPYSTDVAVALTCTLMGLALAARPPSARRLVVFGGLGALAPWFSFPAAFVLAGVGLVLMAGARDRGRAARLALLGAAWAGSLAVCKAVSSVQLADKKPMYDFWGFAFLPLPPRSLDEALWPVERWLYLFVNPLDFGQIGGRTPPALLAAGLFLIGCGVLWRRDRRALGMLLLPGLLAMLASGLRVYPFHGRMLLFFAPALLMLVAEGTAWARRRLGRAAWAIVLAALLLLPTLDALYRLVEPRERGDFNPHGDLRPSALEPGRFPF